MKADIIIKNGLVYIADGEGSTAEAVAVKGDRIIYVGDEAGAAEAVKALQSKGTKDVIVTMGSKGSMVYHEGQATFVHSRKVNAVDTTAAGDTYCGGLCVALSEGKSIIEAAQFATASSALTVQKRGAQDSIPYRKEVIL